MKPRYALAGMFVWLTACASSPPMRFYVLQAAERGATGQEATSQAAGSGSGAQAGSGIRVDRLTIPGELDRPQIVRHISANQLEIAEQDRWAAPLDELIRRVLNDNLAQRHAVAAAGAAVATGAERSVSLDIQEFAVEPDCAVRLRAQWMLAGGTRPSSGTADSMAARRGSISLASPGTGAPCSVSTIPAAMSAALGDLAARLYDEVAKASGSADAPR